MRGKIIFTVLGIVVSLAVVGKAAPMGTAWTYQGRLMDANVPADGIHEFQFELYDLPEDGNQIDGTVALRSVDVIDGYFTVELDFGGSAFDGDARWLQIAVRPTNTADPFTILTPRQEITPAPYALYAANVSTYSDWMLLGDDMYSIPSGNVGIGTSNPQSRLSIQMKGNPISPSDVGGLIIRDGFTNSGNRLEVQDNLGNSNFVVDHVGKVGIGTGTPEASLHVKGTGWPDSFIYLQSDLNNDAGIRLYEGGDVKWHIFNTSEIGGLKICNSDFSKDVFFADQSTGKIGIGTTNPLSKLSIGGNGFNGYGLYTSGTSGAVYAYCYDASGINFGVYAVAGSTSSNDAVGVQSIVKRDGSGHYWSGSFYSTGTSGTYHGLYADVRSGSAIDIAEYILDTYGDTEPGDVLIADPENNESVIKSSRAYDSSVVGVVSTQSHMTIGIELIMDEETGHRYEDVDAAQLVLVGRVPVKVTDENGPIYRGDLLTTSSKPGYAMKWSLLDVNEAKDFEELKSILVENEQRRNAILGKALGQHESGNDKIVALINLQ